jgi:hypothetical protein
MPSHAVSSLCSTPPPKKSRVDGPGQMFNATGKSALLRAGIRFNALPRFQ